MEPSIYTISAIYLYRRRAEHGWWYWRECKDCQAWAVTQWWLDRLEIIYGMRDHG